MIGDSGPSDPATDREEEGLLFRRATELMRAEFEERTWQAFWMVVIDSRRAAEVASQLGCHPTPSTWLAAACFDGSARSLGIWWTCERGTRRAARVP